MVRRDVNRAQALNTLIVPAGDYLNIVFSIFIKMMSKADAPPEFIWHLARGLSEFPVQVKYHISLALRSAQKGGKHSDAKPLKGFKGASVLELVSDFNGETFRAVSTIPRNARTVMTVVDP
jgi:hypothetical protein